jgi:hypothetical protein
MRGIKIGIYSAERFRTDELHVDAPFGCKPLLKTTIA